MNTERQRELENLARDESRSRLEPYRELILRWRRQGRTYRRICALLAEHCNVEMNCGALYRYIMRRSRPRKPQPESEAGQLPAIPAAQIQPGSIPDQTPRYAKVSQEEAARRRDLLQSLRNKPALEPKPAVLEEFRYDPEKPLTIDRSIKD